MQGLILNNAQLIALLCALWSAVFLGILIGWVVWAREVKRLSAYRVSHDAMLSVLIHIADPNMKNPDSMRTMATLALEYEITPGGKYP